MTSILIADNDRAVNGLLSEVLARFGLDVRQAFDGHTASAMARDPQVRLLVCDLDMPGASGIEVLESLVDLSAPPLVVVVSGYLDAGVRARLAALPFVRDALSKPFDLLAFAERVRDLVARDGGGAARPDGAGA